MACPHTESKPQYYRDYLGLRQLLSAQHPLSDAHDELLFIVIHQVYELWFKQIIKEIDSVRAIFEHAPVDERGVALCVRRLQRVKEIFVVLIQQITVLETMSPLDFLSFRNLLYPASGFQSTQFRLLENKLGLSPDRRVTYGSRPYCSYLDSADAATVALAEGERSLHSLIQAWLERTPFLQIGDFDWWQAYQAAVLRMLATDEASIRSSQGAAHQQKQLEALEATRQDWSSLFDRSKHDKLFASGERSLSYEAMQAALLITLYAQEPMLCSPAALLALLVDVDEAMTLWRYRHSLMVHRMLGVKMGTGGSSGYHWLRTTAEKHKVFADLSNISTFLIPRTELPVLPPSLQRQLDFSYHTTSIRDLPPVMRPDSPNRTSSAFSISSHEPRTATSASARGGGIDSNRSPQPEVALTHSPAIVTLVPPSSNWPLHSVLALGVGAGAVIGASIAFAFSSRRISL